MSSEVFWGLMIPLIGTSAGAAMVFFLKDEINDHTLKSLSGFAAGVMFAASVWSLLIPSFEQAQAWGRWSFVPGAVGFWLGILFLLLLDHVIPHLHVMTNDVEGPKTDFKRTTMMLFAVVLHNIPEGMAVGVVYAGYLTGEQGMSAAAALTLSLGIAIQNFPEGAIVSLPLRAAGQSKSKAFLGGVGSGIVEPVAGLITILLAELLVPLLPYFLGFAAGAMIYVVVEELIPEMAQGKHSNLGTLSFAVGFSIMMILDVALG